MTPTQGEHARPEALRLADALASNYFDGKQGRDVWDAAAAELRRLHAQVAALTAAPQGGAYVENPAEIEHVAGDVSKNRAESNMTGGAYAELPASLRAMSAYPLGHCWDALDAAVCVQAAAALDALRASHGQAPAGADWWRKRAGEIEARVAATGSQEAMRCYTDMRALLQAATAQPAPVADKMLAYETALAELVDKITGADSGDILADARAASKALDGRAAPAAGAVAGWQWVPMEPTEAMFTRFSQQIEEGVVYVGGFLQAYRCMLDAAPTPAAQQGDAEDAARWRHFCARHPVTLVVTYFGNGCINKTTEDAVAAIDAERAALAQKEGGHGN